MNHTSLTILCSLPDFIDVLVLVSRVDEYSVLVVQLK
jgi:hypothetical protein